MGGGSWAWGSMAIVAVVMLGCGDDEAAGTGGAGSGGATSAVTSTATSAASTADASSTATATSTTAGSGGGAGAVQCGDDPTVAVALTVRSYVSEALVEGAELTVDLCPGASVTTDAEGLLEAQVQRDVTIQPRLSADGHLTMRIGEQVLVEDLEGEVPIFPELATALLPDWGEDRPSLMALVSVDPDDFDEGDPCATADGFTVSVVDHPEAEVLYFSGEGIPNPDPELESTGPTGLAAFSGLLATDGEASIELLAEKEGCDQVSFVSYPQSGRYALEDGVLTVAVAQVPPTPTPAR